MKITKSSLNCETVSAVELLMMLYANNRLTFPEELFVPKSFCNGYKWCVSGSSVMGYIHAACVLELDLLAGLTYCPMTRKLLTVGWIFKGC